MQRRYFLGLGLGALVTGCGVSGPVVMPPDTTLYVVRHGDRLKEDLSEDGKQRARDLVDALDGEPLDFIFSPSIQRNLDTAAPLSQARGLPISRRAQENPTARILRDAQGQSAIWVGNKNNIRKIWEDLSLLEPAPLEYGDLHVVRSDAFGVVTVERRRFGMP